MNLSKYEPNRFLTRMQEDINNFFKWHGEGNFPTLGESGEVLADWSPRVDIKEDTENFLVKADLPGVDPKDIEVTMENNVLSIKGERKFEKEETKGGYRRKECAYGEFLREYVLPSSADSEHIVAKDKHGVLEITIAKKPSSKPKTIEIKS